VDKLIAAHQLALLANILAVQNQILGMMLSEPSSDNSLEAARRTMSAAAATLENTIGFLQRLSDSEDTDTPPAAPSP
jgi:hypothetical protein